MATIPLQKALANINAQPDEPFSIVYLSYDKTRPNTRGRVVALDNCAKAGASHNTKENQTIGLRPIGNTAHIHTAHIHSIVSYNGQMVIL
jgi:hypothetical protein